MTLAALVLCGGESRRMGRPKAWLPFGAETLLQRVVNILETVTDLIVVVAAPDQELPVLPATARVVRDPVQYQGPLQGLASGLAALPDSVELVYASATDAPFLQSRWVKRLEELIGENDLAIPHVGGYYHPLAALYRRSTGLPAIQELLANDRMRPVFLVDAVKTRVVIEEEFRDIDPALATLRNLNTTEDYAQALRDAGLIATGGP